MTQFLFIFPDTIYCMPGEYLDPHLNQCTSCPMGTFCPEGTSEPVVCPAASFTESNGSINIADCLPGSKHKNCR